MTAAHERRYKLHIKDGSKTSAKTAENARASNAAGLAAPAKVVVREPPATQVREKRMMMIVDDGGKIHSSMVGGGCWWRCG